MNRSILAATLLAALGLAACDRQPTVVNVPTPVAVPGPAGATGPTGSTGNTGRPGDSSVIVVRPASAPTN